MKIAITSGGTKVPLDDIRVLSNISHGTTGALLATYALKAGHTVEYIASKESALPFVGNAAQRLWNGQIQTITDWLADLQSAVTEGRLSLCAANFFQDYVARTLESAAHQAWNDAIILSAAVSDFGPKTLHSGKIDSASSLSLDLEPLPKVRDLIRQVNRDLIVVAFKQMPFGTSQAQLFEKAFRSMEQGEQDLVVANITDSTSGSFQTLDTWILRSDGSNRKLNRRSELPHVLIGEELPNALSRRISKKSSH